MRVLVTRPAREAEQTAAALRALGHEVLVSPVLDVVPTGAPLPEGPFDAAIATSAQAIDMLGDVQVAALLGLPWHLVGQRTKAAAERHGLGPVVSVAADGAKLAECLREAGLRSRNVLYLAGKDRKSGIEEACAKLDCRLSVVEVYEAQAATSLSGAVRASLETTTLDAVLHFSRRSAEVFLALCRSAGLGGALDPVRHLCLSANVAVPLEAAGLQVVVAASPSKRSLFAALETS